MADVTRLGQAGLQGWREKVADVLAKPVSRRTPLHEQQIRAAVGALFFVLSVTYIAKTTKAAMREARG
jgi:hypothetical protein